MSQKGDYLMYNKKTICFFDVKEIHVLSGWIIFRGFTKYTIVFAFCLGAQQQPLTEFICRQPALPRYVEAGYSPLGRSPVVDLCLANPFSMPAYVNAVSTLIKSRNKSLRQMAEGVWRAGGIPLNDSIPQMCAMAAPESFITAFGRETGGRIYAYWRAFVQVSEEARSLLSVISEEEKEWLKSNCDRFFFGEEGNFFQEESMSLKVFELASRVDLARLADCALKLTLIVDDIYQHASEFAALLLKEDFRWQEGGLKLIVSGREHAAHTESADFFIDLGGSNVFRTNAGGTEGIRPAALHIDLFGENVYEGDRFVQGSGFLGVGVLASFCGNNTYQAKAYAQGLGFFGVGVLMNLKGQNRFKIDFGGESCALYGCSLLWNKGGRNSYTAARGMAQAASSTLGVAFLIDEEGGDTYECSKGFAQGGSTGARFYPWIGQPSFYGGVSFLYNGGGNNKFRLNHFGQGSANLFGGGFLVLEGSRNELSADYNAQGQGLHLAAGLLLDKGGFSHFKGGWGSLGAGGDRSAGMFLSTGGNNVYEATAYSLGTGRKPKALGVFIDTRGSNIFRFQKECCAFVQWPATPNAWPRALFLQLGSRYNRCWGMPGRSLGIEGEWKAGLFELLPKCLFFPYHGRAFRPLIKIANEEELKARIGEIAGADYEGRRQLYESIDLYRFTHPGAAIDLSPLLSGLAPEDQLAYAALWGQNGPRLNEVARALEEGTIASPYGRKMAITLVAQLEDSEQLLAKIMCTDCSEENRSAAAKELAKRKPLPIDLLKMGLQSDSELVRYAIARVLRDNSDPFVLPLITPLFQDPSFYVRRAAAMSAISLHDRAGIPVLLETLRFDTLDTTENYGDNIFNELAKYVGVNFGTDKQAWIRWWEKEK